MASNVVNFYSDVKKVNVNFEEGSSSNQDTESKEYIKYRELADKIQVEVYNAKTSPPRDDCLKECKEWIRYNVDKATYNCLFAKCEGQADHLRTTSDKTEDLASHDIYKCLEMYAPNTSFQTIAYMIYKMRYAAALAVSGKLKTAMEEATMGYRTLQAYLSTKQMAKTNASCLYGYVNVHLGQFSSVATEKGTYESEQKNEIFKLIGEGLEQTEMLNGRDKHMWARMFLIKKAFCYLNIGLHGEDIFDPEGHLITESDRENAISCLEEAKQKHWIEADARREMLYNRAQAKIKLLDGQREEAIRILKEALEIAKDFKREEKIYSKILQKWIPFTYFL